jgi:hypothetical protein
MEVVLEYFRVPYSRGLQIKHVLNPNPNATDARAPTKMIWVGGDSTFHAVKVADAVVLVKKLVFPHRNLTPSFCVSVSSTL